MHRLSGWTSRAAVLLPPLVVTLFVVILLDGMKQWDDSAARVQRTQHIMGQLQDLNVRVVDAETAQRGFLITGDSAYLEPFLGAATALRDRLATLRDLLAGEDQLAAVDELDVLIWQRLDTLDEVLAIGAADGIGAGRAALTAGPGRALMDGIRQTIGRIEAEEQRQLALLRASQDYHDRVVTVVLIVGGLLVLATAVLTNLLFRRYALTHERLNAELRQTNARLREQAAELETQAQELQAQTIYLEDTTAELEASNQELEQQRVELENIMAELEATNEELQQTNHALEERTLEAEAANRGKAEFLAAMSHELRTPLNAITGYVDLMRLDVYGAGTKQQTALERIRHNARHLLALINDILHFAKIQAGRIELQAQAVPLRDLLAETETVIAPLVQAKQLQFRADPRDEDVPVLGDHDRIRQILLNLVSNAVKYTDSGGAVTLSTEVDGEHVRIRVRDTGLGIPGELQETIFDPFVQLKRGPGGTLEDGVGLGLSISRELARAMAGDLVVESAPGEGATFILTLQRSAPPVA